MTLASRIKNFEQLIQWLDSRIDGVEIKSVIRHRLAGGCLDVAREHQKAIVLLIAHRLYGSAFSLVRLIFEAYVRGVWLHQCASDVDLKRFETGALDRTFHSLIADIERLESFSAGVLSAVKKKSWSAMNSFTHTGFAQVVRRNKEGTIEPNYGEAELLQALDFANGIALMAAVEIAHLANDDALANELLEKAKEISKLSPNPGVQPRPQAGTADAER